MAKKLMVKYRTKKLKSPENFRTFLLHGLLVLANDPSAFLWVNSYLISFYN